MKSERHTQRSAQAIEDDRFLDAAKAAILAVGWRRTTLTDVARRAGVSRMTLYRRWDAMDALLGDLMTREWTEMVAHVRSDAADPVDRVADSVVGMVHALRQDDLFARILDVDPELLLPYLLERRGRSQDLVLDVLATAIKQGQATGQIRLGKPVVLARSLLLATQGFALSAPTMAQPGVVSTAALDDELHLMVRRFLLP